MQRHTQSSQYNYPEIHKKSGYTSDWQTYFLSCHKTAPPFTPNGRCNPLHSSKHVKPLHPLPGFFDAFKKNAPSLITGNDAWPEKHLIAFWQEYRPKGMRLLASPLDMVPWLQWESHVEYFMSRLTKIVGGLEPDKGFTTVNAPTRDTKNEKYLGREYRYMYHKDDQLYFINYSNLQDLGVDTDTFLKDLDKLLNDKDGLGPESYAKGVVNHFYAQDNLDARVQSVLAEIQISLEDTKMPGVVSNGEVFAFLDLVDGKFMAHICNPAKDVEEAQGNDEKALSTAVGSFVAFAFYCMEKKGVKFRKESSEEDEKKDMMNEKMKEEFQSRNMEDMV